MHRQALLLSLLLLPLLARVSGAGPENLTLLPENPRYFQVEGLPCVLFWGTHHYGWRGYPDDDQLESTSKYANFITIQGAEHRYRDHASLWKLAHDEAHWKKVRRSVEAAHRQGLVVHFYLFDGNYSLEEKKYDRPTWLYVEEKLDEDLADSGLPGVTRRDLHLALIDRVVEHLWEFPRIIFDPVFEMVNTYRWRRDADGFQRWWVRELRERGRRRFPEITHLVGTMWGGSGNYRDGKQSHFRGGQRESHPRDRSMDLILGEHTQDGFFVEPRHNSDRVYDWGVPLVRMGLHAPEWLRGEVHELGGEAQLLMKRQIVSGIHTAEPYNFDGKRWTHELTSPGLRGWMLRTRWYLENLRTWEDEPGRRGGDEIRAESLPGDLGSLPPVLVEVPGYPGGIRAGVGRVEFAVKFLDPEGEAPALAEVWIDLDRDGRFRPDPAAGERLSLRREGPGIYRGEAEIEESQLYRYTFRFADARWTPPVRGVGLVPGRLYRPLSFEGPRASSLPEGASPRIDFVERGRVKVRDEFWAPALERNRSITVPHNLKLCRQTGILANFERVEGTREGDYHGLPNWDEFLYKTIEALALSLEMRPDPVLEAELDAIIRTVARAQAPDGYLRTYVQLAEAGRGPRGPGRWEDLGGGLELYCAGHLFEAAANHFRVTGKRSLLDVALLLAEHIDRRFGPGRIEDVGGHQEIELALIHLHEVTGDHRWLRLSRFFVETRGTSRGGRKPRGGFSQDHAPLIEQREAVGQAPRATYFYSGAADLARLHGDLRSRYLPPLETLWHDVVARKLYINGGIGSRHDNEGFGPPYVLPLATAYSEVCAAISFPLWASRMFRLDPRGEYFDVIERTLYNNLLAGVSRSGDRYFYACPLESDGEYAFNLGWLPESFRHLPHARPSATRKEWFPCACCPPNLARYLFEVPALIYAVDDSRLHVNLYVESEAVVRPGGSDWSVRQETGYPWEGRVRIWLEPPTDASERELTLRLRIPGWARGAPVPRSLYVPESTETSQVRVRINGQDASPQAVEEGYLSIRRAWRSGDHVDLEFPMEVRRMRGDARVESVRGRVALERGPLLFCFEGADHGGRSLDLELPGEASARLVRRPDLPGGTRALVTRALRGGEPLEALAIPYYLWSNRGAGEMAVWLPVAD